METWSNIPLIINRGAPSGSPRIGTGDVSKSPWGGSKGTKIFSLVGKVNNTGLVEVPMGITLREIIYDIGGGIKGGKKFKGVQTGGPSGGILGERHLDLPIDYDQLVEVGSMMGSGGMIVMDEDNCMVDFARYFLSFLEDESCGKCTPCREGITQMRQILEQIGAGKATMAHLDLLQGPGRGGRGRLPLPIGHDGAQPRPDDPGLFPRRIRGAHPRRQVPGRRLQGADHLPH